MTYTSCPNCSASTKEGAVFSNSILESFKITIIKEYQENPAEAYCGKCGKELYKEFKDKYYSEMETLASFLKANINEILVVSTHSPFQWEYLTLGMVTGQSTTGTGVISEFASSITDFFGSSAGMHNSKIREGENKCLDQLRLKTLDLGGNAVIACDIDYSELGGDKGMIMVCMTGTSIQLKNTNSLLPEKEGIISELLIKNNRLKYLRSFK